MVSDLWKACSDADLPKVQEILRDSSGLDIEAKDATGATALVLAIRSGNVDIVKAIIDAGADPSSVAAFGGAESLTSDPTILELLASTREKKDGGEAQPPATTTYYQPAENYSQDYTQEPPKAYYSHPHGAYMYYPPIMPAAPVIPEGASAYYPPPPPPPSSAHPLSEANGGTNLPPPEIARQIPCRYYPACRYGPSCIFHHPQGPYFQGPLPPPAQYHAPYDPLAQQPPYPGYYPAPYPPTSAPPPPSGISPPPGSHQSPQPLPTHGRSGSELVSPVQAPYNPALPPPPMPYGMPPPLPFPPAPMAVASMPPPHVPPQPNAVMYPAVPTSPVMQPNGAPVMHRRNSSSAHPQGMMNGPVQANGVVQSQSIPPNDIPFQRPPHRDTMNARRGGLRRASVGTSRKPPCLFFPSGRCRNGDDCRFPHVLSDAQVPNSAPLHGKFPRVRPSVVDTSLEERMNGLSIRQNAAADNIAAVRPDGRQDVNSRPPNHFRNGGPMVNGIRHDKRSVVAPVAPRQRIPNPEDFPVLAGSITPPSRSPQTNNGPTAAQVLQAPAPVRKDSVKQGQNGGAESAQPRSPRDEKPPKELNGNHVNGNGNDSVLKTPTFASVTTSPAPASLDTPNHVSVSA